LLLSERLTVFEARGRPELLQAGLEAIIGSFLEGRIQASLLVGEPEAEGILLGYYQAAPQRLEGGVWRRITGGWEAHIGPGTWYVAAVFASESLEEAVWLGRKMSKCLGGSWGATRIGPRRLAAGVVEMTTDSDPREAERCAAEMLVKPGGGVERRGLPESASRIERAYREPRWRLFEGAEPLPHKGVARRGPYHVRVGVSLHEGYISLARVDGVFMASPPNEPYNAIAAIQGMPLGPQVLLLLESRLAGMAELYGVEASDFSEALRRAVDLGETT